jgi:lipopolysaccharide transport system permease protein
MLRDIFFLFKRWRIIHLIGISRLRERFARSKFGQAWLTISNFGLILVTGIVWSLIWKMEIDEYLPYVGVGHVIYLFISQTLNESSGIFIADARYYLNERTPFFLSIFSHIYRSSIIFLHNLPIIIILVVWSKAANFDVNIYFFLTFFLLVVFLIFWCYVIAALCVRFRDLIQLFGLLFQLLFLITPVMWKLTFVPEKYRFYFLINPLASFLEIMRNNLIGISVNSYAYITIAVWTLIGILLASIIYKYFDKKIIFWI